MLNLDIFRKNGQQNYSILKKTTSVGTKNSGSLKIIAIN